MRRRYGRSYTIRLRTITSFHRWFWASRRAPHFKCERLRRKGRTHDVYHQEGVVAENPAERFGHHAGAAHAGFDDARAFGRSQADHASGMGIRFARRDLASMEAH